MTVEREQFLKFIRRRKKRLTENLLSFDSSSFAHPGETITTSHRPRTLTAVGALGPSLLFAPHSLPLSKTPPTSTGCLIFIDVSPAIPFVTATSTRVRTTHRCQRFQSSLGRGGIQIETHNDDDRSDEEDRNHAAHRHSNARKQNDIGLSPVVDSLTRQSQLSGQLNTFQSNKGKTTVDVVSTVQKRTRTKSRARRTFSDG